MALYLNSDKSPEKTAEIKEALTLEIQKSKLYDVTVPHPEYKISVRGYVNYLGNDLWRVDKIEFRTDAVSQLDTSTHFICLR